MPALLPRHALPAFLFALLVAVYLCFPQSVFLDADFAWHLATGDLIRQTGRIPETDPWSFTAQGHEWRNLSWLFDVTISALHALGGLNLLYALSVTANALMMALLAREALRRGAALAVTLGVTLLGGCIFVLFLQMRPALTGCGLALAFYLICARPQPRLALWLLPGLMVIWVNAHGSFVAAFSIIGSFWIQALLNGERAQARRLFACGAACGAAMFINPYGWGVFDCILNDALNSAMTPHIAEWGALKPFSDPMTTAWLLALLAALAAGSGRRQPADMLLAAFWLLMALSSRRFTGMMVILSAPFIAQSLSYWMGARLARVSDDIERDMLKPAVRACALAAALLAAAVAASPWPRAMFAPQATALPSDPRYYPAGAVRFIQSHHAGKRFLNYYDIGGGILHSGGGEPKLFIDGRAGTAYPESVIEDYLDFVQLCGFGRKARSVVERWKLDGVIYPAHKDYAKEVECLNGNPDWREVFRDEQAVVYLRAR